MKNSNLLKITGLHVSVGEKEILHGVIVKNGGAELVDKINEKGFSAI
ncbi:hypothetical protein [uncultured Ruminococcus sp.]|nr:hypothetical protein [uncultured Ruminococcus sp.]